MGHAIEYLTYDGNATTGEIFGDVSRFAYDPYESCGYHGNLKFHDNIICSNYNDAVSKIEELDNGWYDDHAIKYIDNGGEWWLVKVEWHC